MIRRPPRSPPFPSTPLFRSPRAPPRGLARLRALPERKVARVALPLVHFDGGARQQLVEILPQEPAVRGEAADLEVDVAVDRVGVAGGDQPLDELEHLGYVFRRLRIHVGCQDPQGGHVLAFGGDIALGEFARRNARFVGASDDPIVDVGVVLDACDPIALEGEVTPDHVEDDGAPRVPDVRVVVHGHPAHVHADFARCEGNEFLLRSGHRVGDPDHPATSTLTTAIAAIPSCRPTTPSPSGFFALTLTLSTSSPSTSASRLAISGSRGARRGAWASTVASTLTRRPPRAVTRSTTFRSSVRLEMPRYRASVSGKCRPRSPSASAPSSASPTACDSTSASEWPPSPRSDRSEEHTSE